MLKSWRKLCSLFYRVDKIDRQVSDLLRLLRYRLHVSTKTLPVTSLSEGVSPDALSSTCSYELDVINKLHDKISTLEARLGIFEEKFLLEEAAKKKKKKKKKKSA